MKQAPVVDEVTGVEQHLRMGRGDRSSWPGIASLAMESADAGNEMKL
jgi:hypothetical protein